MALAQQPNARVWYVSSVKYAALALWQANNVYAVGDLVRANAPTYNQLHVFRCTTPGQSGPAQPAFSMGYNQPTNDNTVVWTDVSGQDVYGWAAAAGSIDALIGDGGGNDVRSDGDIIAVDSNHVQNWAANSFSLTGKTPNWIQGLPCWFVSVNAAGALPPTEADFLAGATVQTGAGQDISIGNFGPVLAAGITFKSGRHIQFTSAGECPTRFRDCVLWLADASATNKIFANNPSQIVWDNVQLQFSNAGQCIADTWPMFLEWRNTPAAIQGAMLPNALFVQTDSLGTVHNVFCHGVDLSALGAGQALVDGGANPQTTTNGNISKFSFYQCKLGAGVAAVANIPQGQVVNGPPYGPGPLVELIDCDSGNTVTRCERHDAFGDMTTSTAIYMKSGSTNFGVNFSYALQSNVVSSKWHGPVKSLPLMVPQSKTGKAVTLTVQLLAQETPPQLSAAETRSNIMLSNGNLTAIAAATTNYMLAKANTYVATGKYYFEWTCNAFTNAGAFEVGLAPPYQVVNGQVQDSGICWAAGGTISGVTAPPAMGAYAAGDILGIAIDFGAQLIWFRKNGGLWNVNALADPTTGTGGASIATLLNQYKQFTPAFSCNATNDQVTFNFGAGAFQFPAPGGYAAFNAAPVALNASEIGLDVDYIANANSTDGRVITSDAVTPFGPDAVIAASAKQWTGGLANGVARQISVTFTPQAKGVLRAVVRMGGRARLVYVDGSPVIQ